MNVYLPIFLFSGAVLGGMVCSAFYARRHRTGTDSEMSSKRSYALIIAAWVASLAALPLCFYYLLDAALGDGGRIPWSHPIGELLMLITGPAIAISVLFLVVSKSKITIGKCSAMLIPCLLSIMELVYSFLLWWTQYR